MIKKVGNKYILYSHDGKKILGKHDTREQADAQELAIIISKHKKG